MPADPGVVWRNWHETVMQPVLRYENVRNTHEGQSTVAGYNETAGKLQALIRIALEQDVPLRAAGGGWSFTNVAAASGIMTGTQRLNYRFDIGTEDLERPYAAGTGPVLLQCGISVADINKYLRSRGQALRTSGASNGQTIAGALGTGTHGAAFDVGAVQDYVVAIHLAMSPDETVWLERKSYPVLKEKAIGYFGARVARDDDELFDAALVSFGSFGVVLGVVIEPDPLYYLHAWRQPIDLTDAVWGAIAAGKLADIDLPFAAEGLADGGRLHHLELIFNPYASGSVVMATGMYKKPTRPAKADPPRLDGGFGKGDSALDAIGVITDHWNGTTPLAAKLFAAAYKPYANVAGTPGEIFKDTSTRGRGASSAMGVRLDQARKAFETAAGIVRSSQAPAIVGMRFVKSTRATLGFTIHDPVTCVLEVDGAYSNRTRQAQQDVWRALEAEGIQYTFHWGKMNDLDAIRVRARYGEARVNRWLDARSRLLGTPELRRVFANEFTDRLGLST